MSSILGNTHAEQLEKLQRIRCTKNNLLKNKQTTEVVSHKERMSERGILKIVSSSLKTAAIRKISTPHA